MTRFLRFVCGLFGLLGLGGSVQAAITGQFSDALTLLCLAYVLGIAAAIGGAAGVEV